MTRNATCALDDPSSEITRLVQTLRDTEKRLQELGGDEVDAVMLSDGHSYLLQEAQRKLRLSEEQFHSMFSTAATGIAISTPNGRYLHANKTYCEMLGHTEEELLKLHVSQLTHPDDLALNKELVDDMLSGRRQTFTMEKRYLNKNGSIVWVSTSVSAVRAAGGEITTMAVIAENITERKMAEFRLNRINRLHRVLSLIGEAVIQSHDRQALYEAVCHIMMEVGLLRTAFIAEVDAEAGIASFVASYGEGLDYLDAPTSILPLDGSPVSQGSIGTVARTGVHDVCNDARADPRMKPLLPIIVKLGVFAIAGFPLKLRGVTIAVLLLYAGEIGYFLQDEVDLMVAIAGDLSFALETMEKEKERKRAEESLQHNQAELQLLFDLMPAMLCAKDTKNVFLRVNQRLAESAGMSVKEIEGKSADELFPNEAAKYYADDLEVLQSGMPKLAIIEKLKGAGGNEMWVQTDKVPVRDKNGNVSGLLLMIQDITERKQLEDSQKRLQERYKRLVDSNVQGVIFWERNGKISGANDAFLRLVRHTREDLEAGRIDWMRLTPPEHAHLDRYCLEEIDAKGIGTPYEKEFLLEDGTRVPVLFGSAAFKDDPNEGVSFVLDLTERKKLEQQFLRAQRLESIGTLASGIAHDLNNILTPIMISIEFLKGVLHDQGSRNVLETIDSSAKRGADIVRQVLTYARGIEGARIEVKPNHLLTELKSIVKDTFPKNINLKFSIPSDVWAIWGDPTQVHQILLNLCVNARDAMPNGGTLSVSAENCTLDKHYSAMNSEATTGRFIQISVTDSGVGIPREIIDRIFEPFFTTKDLSKGTGLGLSTVMAIVKSHRGIVNVYSEPGRGTTFKVYLPAVDAPLSTDSEQPFDQNSIRGNGETILVVDDEPGIIHMIGTTLESFGYKVLTAGNGLEGITVYAANADEIKVVLTDMTMPVMDGAAMIRALRAMNPAIHFIAASGLGSGNVSIPSVKQFLPKPYSARNLLMVLHKMLNEA